MDIAGYAVLQLYGEKQTISLVNFKMGTLPRLVQFESSPNLDKRPEISW